MTRLLALSAVTLLAAPGAEIRAWGRVGHTLVTAEAAERVPVEARGFFSSAAEALAEASLEPDLLKERDPQERSRHYLNLDLLGDPPAGGMPRDREGAVRLYGEAALRQAGSLPWRIVEVLGDLEDAMRSGDRKRVVRVAGHLAHYTGDLFMPLHLTSNFDGQKTCNQGIHEAFESEMIERRASEYRDALRRARGESRAPSDPAGAILEWVEGSAALVDAILDADTAALRALKKEGKDYYVTMEKRAGPIALRQMSGAASAVASLWHAAWIAAGRPVLPE